MLVSSDSSKVVFKDRPKIVVIGAGLAGLTTAYRLHRQGKNVFIYEARGRVGGRIFTAHIKGQPVELGGQNIGDGGAAIHLNHLIDEFELKRVSSPIFLNQAYFDGATFTAISQLLSRKNIKPEALRKKIHRLISTQATLKEILESIVDPLDPLYKILSVKMAAYEGGSLDQLSSLYWQTLFHMLLGGISSVNQAKDAKTSIDLLTIKGGNFLLPQKMAEVLGPKLHLHHCLTKVSRSKTGGFKLTFQENKHVETDILVLAIPCSVFARITFEEGTIPSEKLTSLQNIQYGQNAKIMVPFTASSSHWSGLLNNEAVSFFESSRKILTLYYTGASSFFSPDTIAQTYLSARSMMEQGFEHCPAFTVPSYAKDEANLSYDGPVGYSWPNDPYAKGTYSYIAKGQEDLLTKTVKEKKQIYKMLFAPIDDRLFFAGEHASILFDVPGTMEAACESAERIAQAIEHEIKRSFREDKDQKVDRRLLKQLRIESALEEFTR